METFLGVTLVSGFVVLVFVRERYKFKSTGFSIPSLGRGKTWGGHTKGDAIESARTRIEDSTQV